MKVEVLDGLLVAKTLFDQARRLCFVRDRHVATSGLIVLQDGLEMVMYCALLELDADQSEPIEKLSFDALIGTLRKHGKPIAGSGKLKSLNEQRVLAKHRAQLADSRAIEGYYDAAIDSSNKLLVDVLGKPLNDVFSADLIENKEVRDHLRTAETCLQNQENLECRLAIRKAIYLEFEADYNIAGWNVDDRDDPPNTLGRLTRGGFKAPYYTKNKRWITENVQQPLDFVQVDHSRQRMDLLEAGIDTAEFDNLLRLTPQVVKDKTGAWFEAAWVAGAENLDNSRYCLDVATTCLLRMQLRRKQVRDQEGHRTLGVKIVRDTRCFRKASLESDVIESYDPGAELIGLEILRGFDGLYYVQVFKGFVDCSDCEIEQL